MNHGVFTFRKCLTNFQFLTIPSTDLYLLNPHGLYLEGKHTVLLAATLLQDTPMMIMDSTRQTIITTYKVTPI